MQTIYMLEGPDGAGKSTLGDALSNITNIPYYKPSVKKFEDRRETRLITANGGDTLANYLLQTGNSVIFDRNYPSEWVYSRVFGVMADEVAIFDLDNKYADMRAIIIYVDRFSYEGVYLPDISQQQITLIKGWYGRFMERTRCRVVVAPALNGSVQPYDRAYATIERLIQLEEGGEGYGFYNPIAASIIGSVPRD